MANPAGLRRTLTLLDGAALIIGTTIGSGIFRSPGRVLGSVGSVGLALMVWIVAGLLSIAGALCYAELGSALPVSGGEYAYLKKTLGRPIGFLFTWTNFFVMKTGSQAIITLVFATYFGSVLFGLDPRMPGLENDPRLKALAVGTIILLTGINCIGVRWGALLQVIFTLLKLIALGGIVALGFGFLTHGGGASFQHPFVPFTGEDKGSGVIGAFGLAMISALWAYDGWNNLNYVTEELQEPERNLPRALVLGILGIMAVYVLANIAYLAVLSPQEMVASKAVATDLAVRVLGPIGGLLIPLAVAISTFGSANGSIFSGSRILYAAARDGQFPKVLARVNPQTGVPTVALVVQGFWACCLVIPGDFGKLVDYFGLAAWVFYGLAAIALIVLRIQAPSLPRPYKVAPYPLIPVLFLAVSTFLVLNLLFTAPLESIVLFGQSFQVNSALLALGFILLGLPVYALFFRNSAKGGN